VEENVQYKGKTFFEGEQPDMPPIKRIAILGAGAMGGAYAAMFHTVEAFETLFIARGPRAERLAQDGMVVNGKTLHLPVVRPDQANTPADLVMVALKHHHLGDALNDLRPLVGEQTTIISIMNGLESEKVIGAAYGAEKLVLSIAVGIDALRDSNRISYSNPGKILFGETWNREISPRVRQLQAAFDKAGIPHETPEDMRRTLWWKFMINVGMNQASAVMQAPYGVFQTSEDARALMRALMQEVITLAQESDVNLSEADIEDWCAILQTLSPEGKTSMLQDIEAGRPTEVDVFAGKVVTLGKKRGIATPVNAALLHAIRVLASRKA
jgi:2-dehydropantoate 2-reductase